MQYRVNFLVDGLNNITIWRNKCRVLKSVIHDVHTPIQLNSPELTRPRFSNSYNIFKCQWPKCI